MQNIALIFAGGTGQRMNSKTKPKQFLELHGKPIIVYTLEVFEECKMVDGIVLVMLEDWIPYTEGLITKHSINKVVKIVPGGKTGQESIFNGLKGCAEYVTDSSIVLIHDGVRPLVDIETIERCICITEKRGSAITVSPAIETIALLQEDGTVGDILPRTRCQMAKAPQCFRFYDIFEVHKKAVKDNRLDFIDSASMMQHYGYKLSTVIGPSENIKITTPSDFYIFRAIIDEKENSQIFGM